MTDINEIIKATSPETLAEIAVKLTEVMGKNDDFVNVYHLSNIFFNAGIEMDEERFCNVYFDAVSKLKN